MNNETFHKKKWLNSSGRKIIIAINFCQTEGIYTILGATERWLRPVRKYLFTFKGTVRTIIKYGTLFYGIF